VHGSAAHPTDPGHLHPDLDALLGLRCHVHLQCRNLQEVDGIKLYRRGRLGRDFPILLVLLGLWPSVDQRLFPGDEPIRHRQRCRHLVLLSQGPQGQEQQIG